MRCDVLVMGLRNVADMQGGIETHVRNLSTELDRLGVRVGVCVRSPYAPHGQTLPGTNVQIVRLWSPRMVAAEALLHTLFCIFYAAVTRPRLIHIHAVGPSLMVPLARLCGLSVVTTHHGEDYQREKWGILARKLLKAGEICQARFAHRTLCVSRSLSRRLSMQYGREFTHIPNGVVRPRALASTAVLNELGLQPGTYVLTVGRIVPEKRHLDLIAAWSRLPRRAMQLVIVGLSDRKSERHGRMVAQAATRSGNVVLAGFRSGVELQALYENAALFVLPSSHEGMPIALLEAMAHGCPVLVSDLDVHHDLELGARNYHAVGDIDEIATKIDELISPRRATPVCWDAHLRPFQWPVIARKTLDVYRDLDPAIASESYALPDPTETPVTE